MTAPDVLRSMAAHPSSQRPKVLHIVCLAADLRLCGGSPVARVRTTPSPSSHHQRCVVCDDLTQSRCAHCGKRHGWWA